MFQGSRIAWEVPLLKAASTGLRRTKRKEMIAHLAYLLG